MTSTEKKSAIEELTSSLDSLELKDLREGPEQGFSPPADYPDLPSSIEDGENCYALGWFLDDVSERMTEVANCEVKRRGESGFNGMFTKSLAYMRRTANYHHLWIYLVPKSEEGPHLPPDFIEYEEDEGLVPLLTIGCSAPNVFCRRLSQAQFEWFNKVLGKKPHWVMIEQSRYDSVDEVVWRERPCCSSGSGVAHLVDLETKGWKHPQTGAE